jgi:surface protein
MSGMFSYTTAFNQKISSWNTSNVTNMSFMFQGAESFNNGELTNTGQNPLNWNTSSLIRMGNMFAIGSFQSSMAFNQPINTSGPYWNTSNVTEMFGVFVGPSLFNQPIGNWNTANVTNMNSMFKDANIYNQSISSWDTSKVTDMQNMFRSTTAFKQDISNWTPYACTNMSNMFLNVDMNSPNSATNQTNYNALLTSWGNNPRLTSLKNSVPFHAGTSKYTTSVAGTARLNLTNSTGSGGKGWTITDGGGV